MTQLQGQVRIVSLLVLMSRHGKLVVPISAVHIDTSISISSCNVILLWSLAALKFCCLKLPLDSLDSDDVQASSHPVSQ